MKELLLKSLYLVIVIFVSLPAFSSVECITTDSGLHKEISLNCPKNAEACNDMVQAISDLPDAIDIIERNAEGKMILNEPVWPQENTYKAPNRPIVNATLSDLTKYYEQEKEMIDVMMEYCRTVIAY